MWTGYTPNIFTFLNDRRSIITEIKIAVASFEVKEVKPPFKLIDEKLFINKYEVTLPTTLSAKQSITERIDTLSAKAIARPVTKRQTKTTIDGVMLLSLIGLNGFNAVIMTHNAKTAEVYLKAETESKAKNQPTIAPKEADSDKSFETLAQKAIPKGENSLLNPEKLKSTPKAKLTICFITVF